MDGIASCIPKESVTELVFFVNGKKVVEPRPDPESTLLWYLRKRLHLTGTKYGCSEGGCGACTVMVSRYYKNEDIVVHRAVNACLTPLCAMHGLAVTTVEGIGSTHDRLHPVQERIAKAHGSQCGFCTPGIVMSVYALLRNNTKITYKDIETSLQGNLCRCTGYRPIVEGFKTFTEGWANCASNGSCMLGKDCCKNKEDGSNENVLFNKSAFQPYDPSQEPIFPPELKINYKKYNDCFLFYNGENVAWIRPKTLKELLYLKKASPESKIVVGNTEIGVDMKFKKHKYPVLLSPMFVDEMNSFKVSDTSVLIGAAVSLTEVMTFLNKVFQKEPNRGKILKSVVDTLDLFASNQIRNVASLVGNIITASPISDLNPILMACAAKLNVCSYDRGNRQAFVDENFFKAYRKPAIENDEIVLTLEIPFSKTTQFVKVYKQSRRRDDDIAIVTAAFNIIFDTNYNIVEDAKICFGGMGSTTLYAANTSNLIKGCKWNQEMLNKVFESLNKEMELNFSAPGGMAEYRKSLCLGLFFKFFLYVFAKIKGPNDCRIAENEVDEPYEHIDILPKSSQYFEIKDDNRNISDSVGKPVVHTSALKQATGEAIYCDDIPQVEGELCLKLVFSSESYAKIKKIDASKALSVPGVVAFVSACDLDPESNKVGPIINDEEVFVSETVTSRACVLGAIVAKTESAAQRAKDLVSVTYEQIQPVIVTLEDAIAHESYFSGYPKKLKKGDVNEVFATSKHILEGFMRSGAQEHFYLETISAFAIRKEDELEIICTSQNPADIASVAAKVLRIPNHKVVCKVKRIGGGFGGKETRTHILAIPVAVAAYKLKKPVRAVFDRDEDMQCTGYRHPFLIKYKVAFNDNGKILGTLVNIYINAGYSLDISCSMMDRAFAHVDNCYYIPNIEINGYLCKTNTPSNTAFRGFGAPKAMLCVENMIRDIAISLGKNYEKVAQLNMYQEGQLTHYNQPLIYCSLNRCWNQCIETSNYWQRKKDVEEFNRVNRWQKKGISLVPTKYGISFQSDVLMQAGALLLIYKDGSILLSIGGIEMGQGLFTKMIQVASRVLQVDIDRIHINEMSTDKVPNSSPTAASISSDLYGMAVVNACNIMNERLEPYKIKNPDGKWEDWVLAAYLDRVSLSTTGFYAAPHTEYNRETNSGNLYEYFTYGVACSEVIIDCLTGNHQALRTDIVMDVGESLNPAIDIGQIEGAFTQGYGFCTMEEMIFSPTGEVLSRGPGAYKIPGISDIPKEFNVSLLKGAPNPRAVYSSKAIGEPPLFLAASVFFAIKEAIRSARLDAGASKEFTLNVPATCERIRMACEDHITERVKATMKKEGKPWNVVA